MLTFDQIKNSVSKIGKRYGVKSAFLFGSYAKGEATEKSDVDILIDRGEIDTYDSYYHFCADLENELNKEISLVSMDGTRPNFLKAIEKDKVLLYGA